MRKLILVSLLTLAFGYKPNAQVVISSLGTPYTQNFDALSNDTTFATAHPITPLTGWAIFEKGTSTAVDQQYKVSYGSRTNGETYSYGDSTSTDRALGSLASGTNLPAFGVVFQNNTGADITDLTISYKGEQWRSGDTVTTLLDSLIFEYSTTATGINDSTATWNPISALMFNSPNMIDTTAGALNGNIAPNFATKSGTISVLIANGSKISLRWRDVNKASGDDGLAIDDLSVNFAASGNPKPSIIAFTPADDATLVSPTVSTLTMTFDQPIVSGNGDITVKNLTDALQQIIPVSSTSIAGAVVTIPGITLVSGKQYAVNFDSTCYTSSTSSNSYGIYDNTTWNFYTQPNGLFDVKANNLEMHMMGSNAISFNLSTNEVLTLSIVDMNGNIVSRQMVNGHTGENIISLSNQSFANGMYFVTITNASIKGSVKFNKQ
jgi:hypothetical protein